MEIFVMKPNVGVVDRGIRLVLAAVLLYLGLAIYGGSTLGIGLVAVGVVLLMTGLLGFCGLYQLLGIQTCPTKTQS
jgi:hypothetical protein